MKKLLLFVASIALSAGLYAQEDTLSFKAPDYLAIKELISDPDSEFYYPVLLERMKQNDPLLMLSEYRALYYGSVFQPNRPLFPIRDEEAEILKYYQRESIPKKEYDKIIKLINQALEKDPFYFRGMTYLGYILHLKGEEEEAAKMARRSIMIQEAIYSSGNGRTPETAFHVIDIGHEYVLMSRMGLQYGKKSTVWIDGNACDCFELKDNDPDQICWILPYKYMSDTPFKAMP